MEADNNIVEAFVTEFFKHFKLYNILICLNQDFGMSITDEDLEITNQAKIKLFG